MVQTPIHLLDYPYAAGCKATVMRFVTAQQVLVVQVVELERLNLHTLLLTSLAWYRRFDRPLKLSHARHIARSEDGSEKRQLSSDFMYHG